MNRRRLVRVPASSANLGPGYDVLAAALSLGLELEVEETGEFSVECDVPGVPLDRTNLCVRAFEALHPADGLAFRIRSEIPPSAGLGSSAAAIVAGPGARPTTCTSSTRRCSSSPASSRATPTTWPRRCSAAS